MSERRDSDPRPRPWQGRALPTELLSHYFQKDSAGLTLIRQLTDRALPTELLSHCFQLTTQLSQSR